MPKMPKMPIDVMAILQEATDVEAARSVPLCVSVLLDDTAPDGFRAFEFREREPPSARFGELFRRRPYRV